MNWAGYYLSHSIVNGFKKLFTTTMGIIIVCCFGFGIICGGIGALVGALTEDAAPQEEIVAEEVTEEVREETEEDFLTPDQFRLCVDVMLSVGGVLVILGLGFASGKKLGRGMFSMADVNLMFSAPIRPQSLLLFRAFTKIGLLVLTLFYLLLYLPSMFTKMGFSAMVGVIASVAVLSVFALSTVCSIFSYTLAGNSARYRKSISPIFYGVLLALAAAFLLCWKQSGDIFTSLETMFSPTWTRWIPLFGWPKGAVMYALESNWGCMTVCFLLEIAAAIVIAFICWRMQADFYEDAIHGAEQMQETLDKLEKSKGGVFIESKNKDKTQEMELKRGSGATVFFYRAMLDYRRGLRFGMLSDVMIFLLLAAAGCCAVKKIVVPEMPFLAAVLILLLLQFFLSMVSPLRTELDNVFFQLAPSRSFIKCMCVTVTGVFINLINLLPAMILCGAVFQASLPAIVCWTATLLAVALFFSETAALGASLLPESMPVALQSMAAMMIQFGMMIPAGLIVLVGYLATKTITGTVMTLTLGLTGLSLLSVFFISLKMNEGK